MRLITRQKLDTPGCQVGAALDMPQNSQIKVDVQKKCEILAEYNFTDPIDFSAIIEQFESCSNIDGKLQELITDADFAHQLSMRVDEDPIDWGIKNFLKNCSVLQKVHFYCLLVIRNQQHQKVIQNGFNFDFQKKKFFDFDTSKKTYSHYFGAKLDDFKTACNNQEYSLALIYWMNLSINDKRDFLIELSMQSPVEFERHSHVIATIIPLLTSMPGLNLNKIKSVDGKNLFELAADKPALFDAFLNLSHINADININGKPLLIWLYKHRYDVLAPCSEGGKLEHVFTTHPELKKQMTERLTAEHWSTLGGRYKWHTFAGLIVLNLNNEIFSDLEFDKNTSNLELNMLATKNRLSIIAFMYFYKLDNFIEKCFGDKLLSDELYSKEVVYENSYSGLFLYSCNLFLRGIVDTLKLNDQEKMNNIRTLYLKGFSELFSNEKIDQTINFVRDYQPCVFRQLKLLLENYSDEELETLQVRKKFTLLETETAKDAIVSICIALLFPTAQVTPLVNQLHNGKLIIAWLYLQSREVFFLLCQHPKFNPYEVLNFEGDTIVSCLIKTGDIEVLSAIPQYTDSKPCFSDFTPLQYAARYACMATICKLLPTEFNNYSIFKDNGEDITLFTTWISNYSTTTSLLVKGDNGVAVPFLTWVQCKSKMVHLSHGYQTL